MTFNEVSLKMATKLPFLLKEKINNGALFTTWNGKNISLFVLFEETHLLKVFSLHSL